MRLSDGGARMGLAGQPVRWAPPVTKEFDL